MKCTTFIGYFLLLTFPIIKAEQCMVNFNDNFYHVSNSLSPVHYIAETIKTNHYKVVAIIGPSCGGKTTFSQQLHNVLGHENATLINVDDYWCYTRAEMKQRNLTGYDWESRDKKRFLKDIECLKNNIAIDKPLQNYEYECPANITERIDPKDIIILEATLDFSGIADLIIFMYAPEEIIFQRRLKRDCNKKAFETIEQLAHYLKQKSIPAYKEKLLPLIHTVHFIVDSYENKLYANKAYINNIAMIAT